MEKITRGLQFSTENFGRGGQSTIVLNLGLNIGSNILFDYFIYKISENKSYKKIIKYLRLDKE